LLDPVDAALDGVALFIGFPVEGREPAASFATDDPAGRLGELQPGLSPLASALCCGPSPTGRMVADITVKLHLSETIVRNCLSTVIGKAGTR